MSIAWVILLPGLFWGPAPAGVVAAADRPDPSALPDPLNPGETGMTDIHDIKPVLALVDPVPAWFWIALLAGLLLALTAVFCFYRRRRHPRAEAPCAPLIPPDVKALNALEQLAAERYVDVKSFYFRLSAILRVYLEERYAIAAAEMTTEELLPAAAQLAWPAELTTALAEFCHSSDPVKFADAPAAATPMANHLNFVRHLVHQTRMSTPGTPKHPGPHVLASAGPIPPEGVCAESPGPSPPPAGIRTDRKV